MKSITWAFCCRNYSIIEEIRKSRKVWVVPSKVRSRANTFPAVKRRLLSASSGSCLHYALSRDVWRQSLSLLSAIALVFDCPHLIVCVLTIIHAEILCCRASYKLTFSKWTYSLGLSDFDRIGHNNLRVRKI